jgi:hypothetical protein
MQGVADYGKLGHGECVGLTLPSSAVKDFAAVYFSLFDKNGVFLHAHNQMQLSLFFIVPRASLLPGDRPDKGDRGPEYRSLLGLPGGTSSPLYADVAAAAAARGVGLTLAAGKGDDPDTVGKGTVWVMDTAAFPFHQGEVYHQYHDGFMPGENYPDKEYNGMRDRAYKAGRLKSTGCPDSVA